ncbi:MAG TPA: acetate/propionate family kinase [Candidatus Eremiobacteraceae bacterium]|nr:acetate/propionate family kinase [Candidatus Eremiobacteraceae bacterium]
MRILALDGGSSSLKFALYATSDAVGRFFMRGAAENLGPTNSLFWYERADGNRRVLEPPVPLEPLAALDRAFEAVARESSSEIDAIGHRIVFGGPDHVAPTHAAAHVLADLERFVPFDPMHLRTQIDLVRAAMSRYPRAKHVLCFDTEFHRRMPNVAKRLPLPRSVGPLVRRYGYHGISYEYVISTLGPLAEGRVLIAHLGSGASLAAVRDGQPIDTTMGFSPLGGLMMGTRPGDLDPGILLYLLSNGSTASDLVELFSERSGLAGVSQHGGDLKTLLERETVDVHARDAIELFVYQIVKHAGSMIAVLGGLDTLVFTGGIGERSAEIRGRVAHRLSYVGACLDPAKNAAGERVVSSAESRVTVHVIQSDESLIIARKVQATIKP